MASRDRYTRTHRRIIEVPIDGEKHYLRTLTETERTLYESQLFDEKGKVSKKAYDSQRRRLLVLTLCDEHGSLFFNPNEEKELIDMDGDLAGMLFDEATRQCLGAKERINVEALEKKSDQPTASSSHSDSV